MDKFKVGDKVRCINARISDLIEGQIYTISKIDDEHVSLKEAVEIEWWNWRFELVEESPTIRNTENLKEDKIMSQEEIMKQDLIELANNVDPNKLISTGLEGHLLEKIKSQPYVYNSFYIIMNLLKECQKDEPKPKTLEEKLFEAGFELKTYKIFKKGNIRVELFINGYFEYIADISTNDEDDVLKVNDYDNNHDKVFEAIDFLERWANE